MRFDMIVKKFFFVESLSNENRFLWAKDVLIEGIEFFTSNFGFSN